MTAPHELPIPGPAADAAERLAAHLPVIDTRRLCLRVPSLDDFPVWAEIFTGAESRHMDGPVDRDTAFTEFAACVGIWLLRGHGPWVVRTRDGTPLGFVLIGFEPGDREPELGFMLLPAAQGLGYAQEAAAAVLEHATSAMALPSLVSYIAPENAPSRRLAARLGARPDGSVDGCEVWRHHPEIPA